MNDGNPMQPNGASDSICFAEMTDGVIVVKVRGRGSFSNSVDLKQIADHMIANNGGGKYRFVIDLSECVTMDSTFMGVLASIGLRQKRDTTDKMTIVNANEQNLRLLRTLGLSHFINVRAEHSATSGGVEYKTSDTQDISKVDRIVHMIEAHQNLCDIDSKNIVQFETVLKYLHESLEKEKNNGNG